MPYLDAVVKETWRCHPVVPMVPRRAVRDFTLGGHDVPQVCVCVCVCVLCVRVCVCVVCIVCARVCAKEHKENEAQRQLCDAYGGIRYVCMCVLLANVW